MSYVLVYQGGIANVFAVDRPTLKPEGRNARRVLQYDFHSCRLFARGLMCGGHPVATAFCNRAGDIAGADWSGDQDEQPFADKLIPVGPVLDD